MTLVQRFIGDWNRKHKKSKTISSRVDVFLKISQKWKYFALNQSVTKLYIYLFSKYVLFADIS